MTVDEYLDAAPEPHRSTLLALRATLRELLPDATEALSYGVPAFKVDGVAVAGYAHHKEHCGYYPHSESVLPAVEDQLSGFEWSRGTLRFAIDEPLPTALVARLVEVRLAELEA